MTKKEIINEKMQNIKVFDVHTHLDAKHLSARGLHDILLYHMVVSDLYSAGCPNGLRLSEEPDNHEATSRIEQALAYLPFIQNTSCFWGIKIILSDLYGWDKPITKNNWHKLDAIIKDKYKNPAWPKEVMKRAGIEKAIAEYSRRNKGEADDVLDYCMEWAFFARNQWGRYDAPLIELEYAWNADQPMPPLPVTFGITNIEFEKKITRLADVKKAIKHYCNTIPFDKVLCTVQHLSTDVDYISVQDSEMEQAIKKRKYAGQNELNIYSSYILELFLDELEKWQENPIFQFSLGAEPLPFETGSKLKADTIFQIANFIARHPNIRFQISLSSTHQNQALCTLARELPNISLSGYWWHSFFPVSISQIIRERLEMLSIKKQMVFFSDAYCIDWSYAKVKIVKTLFTDVLDEKIKLGQYSLEQALEIAEQLFYYVPKDYFGF